MPRPHRSTPATARKAAATAAAAAARKAATAQRHQLLLLAACHHLLSLPLFFSFASASAPPDTAAPFAARGRHHTRPGNALPTVVEDGTMLNLDSRLGRSDACLAEEDAVAGDARLHAALLTCWTDSCACRGGLWDPQRLSCTHRCHQVSCPPRTCRAAGATCDPSTGACVYTQEPDGTPCAPDAVYAALQQAETPTSTSAAAYRCYYGRCLPSVGCDGAQCALPASECFAVGCAAGTGGGGGGGGACAYPRLNGTLCTIGGGEGVCVDGVCGAFASQAQRHYEDDKRGVARADPCARVVCARSGRPHPCLGAPVCVNGACESANVTDGTPCDDGVAWTVGETCLGGSCQASIPCLVPRTGTVRQCTSSNPECTVPACLSDGQCVEVDKPDGTVCDDQDATTVLATCSEGRCVGASVFYGCANHAVCLPHLLSCLQSTLPACNAYHRGQCRSLSSLQHCPVHPDSDVHFCQSAAVRVEAPAAAVVSPVMLLCAAWIMILS